MVPESKYLRQSLLVPSPAVFFTLMGTVEGNVRSRNLFLLPSWDQLREWNAKQEVFKQLILHFRRLTFILVDCGHIHLVGINNQWTDVHLADCGHIHTMGINNRWTDVHPGEW